MSRIEEQLNEQFYHFEKRGRGWTVYDEPVRPEPPFTPFFGHYISGPPPIDDGRKPTFLSSFVEKLSRRLTGEQPPSPIIPEVPDEPEPETLIRDALVELSTSLPANLNVNKDAFEHLIANLSNCQEPIAFEILGLPGRVSMQFAAHTDDARSVHRQLHAHFPEAVFQPKEGTLLKAWDDCEGDTPLVVEFGLAREFMFPLAIGKMDPFIGIIGALSELEAGELGLFQVLFEPVRKPWSESITRSVTHADGSPFFVNAPELTAASRNKITRPLFAAVVRIAIKTPTNERTLRLASDLAGSLRVFANPQGNELIPLENSEYPIEAHIEDVISRQSRRSGMILTSDELIGFVHLPSSTVRSSVLQRETKKTKLAPSVVHGTSGVLLGINNIVEGAIEVRLMAEQRVRHVHIVGASGTGKSTLLFNLIREDIYNQQGLAVLDPHGDLIDRILGIIPPHRINDVVLVDPSDEQFSVGFNILSAHSDLEKNLLASDLVSVFERLSTSWGDQMGSVLQNAILAFLESDQGGTLSDLRRFLIEPAYRERFLKTVRDPDIVYYWKKAFTQLSGNRSIGPVLTRLETFLSPKPIRYMVSQPTNRLDFGQIIDTGKIFLAKLPQGQMGKENSFLLGSLLVAKFQQLAMGRQAQKASERKDFWLYLDEFHNFITPSMAEILTGARKYRLGLTLAHQELRQLERDREVSSAVLSNPYTSIVFRVGDSDARALENGFSFFEARDFQNLETGQAICRIEKADWDFNLTIPLSKDSDTEQAEITRQAVIAASRARYATPRAQVEAALLAKLSAEDDEPVKAKPVPPVRMKVPESETVPAPKAVVPEVEKVVVEPPPKVTPVMSQVVPPPPIPEVKPETTVVPVTAEPSPPVKPVPEGKGIGGHQHNLVRERIESVARSLGYYPAREKRLSSGGKIDVALEKGNQTIACEISFTTTIDHEVGNVAKCLKAGCEHVAVICSEETRLKKIEKAVIGCLSTEEVKRVGYYLPDQFISYLESRKSVEPVPPATEELKLGKYKVKRHSSKLTTEEAKAQEALSIKILAETMRRKP